MPEDRPLDNFNAYVPIALRSRERRSQRRHRRAKPATNGNANLVLDEGHLALRKLALEARKETDRLVEQLLATARLCFNGADCVEAAAAMYYRSKAASSVLSEPQRDD